MVAGFVIFSSVRLYYIKLVCVNSFERWSVPSVPLKLATTVIGQVAFLPRSLAFNVRVLYPVTFEGLLEREDENGCQVWSGSELMAKLIVVHAAIALLRLVSHALTAALCRISSTVP